MGNKIVFRDVKPDNLFLTDAGRVKLTGMACAKIIAGKTFTSCGTPDYMSPEVIESVGHTHATDWWSFGVVAYELMTGVPPFEALSPILTMTNIKKGIESAKFPVIGEETGYLRPGMPGRGGLEKFVKDLCQKVPSRRLPMKPGGMSNLKGHSWFGGLDFATYEVQQMEPPFKPSVEQKLECMKMANAYEEVPKYTTFADDTVDWDTHFATSTDK